MTEPHIDREIILDLLPLYRAGMASAPSRRLVEQWLQAEDGSEQPPGEETAPDVELAALRRARSLLRWQRRLYGSAIGLTVLSVTTELRIEQGKLLSAHLLGLDYPWVFGPVVLGTVACWVAYFRLKARLR
ncbi:MAG: hypothetical protein JWN66_4524 [Sphingomonas bacterium]|uniref:hypothetical protein n=1 Tax=Sphingomonas bacterium TaxID=1895847 RepID=UPI002636A99A|nr:hypothetical protein [Sphingomonas bacterium]MDB5707408.1 hypothetical protein [Sphingomonas bacterium]